MLSPVFAAFGLVLVAACANVSNVMLARAVQPPSRDRDPAVARRQPRPRRAPAAHRGAVDRRRRPAPRPGARRRDRCAAAPRCSSCTLPPSFAGGGPGAAARLRLSRLRLRAGGRGLDDADVRADAGAPGDADVADRTRCAERAGSGVGGSRLRSLLVVGQVTVSLVLIVIATTLARNSSALERTDPGFPTASLVSIKQRTSGRGCSRRRWTRWPPTRASRRSP